MPESASRKYGYREEVLNILLKMLEPFEDVTRDNMFGFPSFRASGRIFACVYESGISLKMPVDAADKIVNAPGISPFIPFGRARMRQWIHIERKKVPDFKKDISIIEASIHYVRTLPLPADTRARGRKAPAKVPQQAASKGPAPAARERKSAVGKTKDATKAASGSQRAKATKKAEGAKKAGANKSAKKQGRSQSAKPKARKSGASKASR
jgi:hypothetical protein